MKELFIVGAKRTPIGSFCGTLAWYTAPQLGAKAIAGALEIGRASCRERV